MAKGKKIKPELVGGFRDYLPADMVSKQLIIDKVRGVFEQFGFSPFETPCIEKEKTLTGGDKNFKKQIFRIKGNDKLALRFDLTVPLARIVAQYPGEIKKPARLYQIGKTWRGERQQAGRYKEFLQFDADIIGSSSMMADSEIISVISEIMFSLGIDDFLIRANNRKILNGLADYAGFSKGKTESVLRIMDKIEKQGRDSVLKELRSRNGVGLSKTQSDKIGSFLEIKDRSSDKEMVLKKIMNLMGDIPSVKEGVGELRLILESLNSLGVPGDKWVIDVSVARGLGYYTGPVFETFLTDLPEMGSIASGGRYDGLVERFSKDVIPATGFSMGIDRLYSSLEKLGRLEKGSYVKKAVVLNFDKNCEDYIQKIAAKLRRGGVKTEIYLDNKKPLKSQIISALESGASVIIIAGEEEKRKNAVQVKDVESKKQSEIGLSRITEEVKTILKIT